MDVEFIEPRQYKNGAFIIPVTLEDLHLYRQVTKIFIFMGLPYDKTDPERVGSDFASQKIRETLINVSYYDLSASLAKGDICFLDLGDLKSDQQEDKALNDLYCWVAETFNQLPRANIIIVGGLREQTTKSLQALVDGLDYQHEVQIVQIDNDLSNLNLFQNEAFMKTKSEMLFFGVSGSITDPESHNFIEGTRAKVLYMDRDIRRKVKPFSSQCHTQAGWVLEQMIDNKSTPLILSIHCEAISSAYCPGQSRPNMVGGLTCLEMKDVVSLCAKRIRIMNICGFNPAVESQRSSELIASLIYDYIEQIRSQS